MSDDKGANSPPAAQLERQIEHTRADLALTLDALERKLATRRFVEKGITMFKDNFIGQEGLNRGLDTIRANPVPVALIGIGAAWLIANNTNAIERLASNERVEATRRRVVGLASDAGSRASELASDLGNRASELASNVASSVGLGGSKETADRPLGHTGHPIVDTDRDRPSGWVHQVSDLTQGAVSSARDSGQAIFERASDYASNGASRIADRLTDAFDRHPLAIGAIGVMAGALLAALLPATRAEDELLGETSDELWHKARETGGEAVARVRDVAVKAAERVADAAASTATESLKEEPPKPLGT